MAHFLKHRRLLAPKGRFANYSNYTVDPPHAANKQFARLAIKAGFDDQESASTWQLLAIHAAWTVEP
jgi:hypothetical protein